MLRDPPSIKRAWHNVSQGLRQWGNVLNTSEDLELQRLAATCTQSKQFHGHTLICIATNDSHSMCLSHPKTCCTLENKKNWCTSKILKISPYCSYLAGLKLYHSAAVSAFYISLRKIANTVIFQLYEAQISAWRTFRKLQIIGASKL